MPIIKLHSSNIIDSVDLRGAPTVNENSNNIPINNDNSTDNEVKSQTTDQN